MSYASSICHRATIAILFAVETINTLFCDGHVKSLKLDALNARHTVGTDGVMYL